MKKFFYTLSVLVCLLGVSENAWGFSTAYYTKVSARSYNSIAVGKVYAGASNSTAKSARVSEFMTSVDDDPQGTANISAWANIQNDRYALYKWEFISASARSYSKTEAWDATKFATLDLTSNPLVIPMVVAGHKENGNTTGGDDPEKATWIKIRAIFYRPGGVTIDNVKFLATEHGSYSVKELRNNSFNFTNIQSEQKSADNVKAGDPIECKAVPAEGYIFYSYYTKDAYGNKAYVGDLLVEDQILLLEDDVVEVGAEFTDNAFRIGDTFVKTLSDALQVVRTSTNKIIQVVRSHTVEAGYYTIPAGVTLLLPRDVDQQDPMGIPDVDDDVNNPVPSAASKPEGAYKTLTLGAGVKLDVFGEIECTSHLRCVNPNSVGAASTARGTGGSPGDGKYGHLVVGAGSSVVLNSGAELRAWGFVTGDGEIEVRRGAVVREPFQMYDWKGGSCTDAMCSSSNKAKYKVYPVNSYFIQNIETRTTYRPGAKLLCFTAVYAPSVPAKGSVESIGIIGAEYENGTKDDALFLMADNDESADTYVCKYYDVTNDKQVYEINNSARIGSLHFSAYSYDLFSEDYVLPIASNMVIHLKNGQMNLTQDTELLPGSIIEADKKSTMVINPNTVLYLYDADEWGKYSYNSNYHHHISYRPGVTPDDEVRDISSAAALGDAQLNIHGTLEVQGALYTTSGGANIFSSNEDAGTIVYKTPAPAESVTKTLYQPSNANKDLTKNMVSQTAVPAVLQNEDTGHPTTSTANTPAGQSYCYMNDKWTMMTVDPDSSCFVYDQYDTYYAKPQGFVAINATKNPSTKKITGNIDHTYSDAAGTGRLFILMDGCQWWEVENVDNLYHCIHPLNDTYYYWDDVYQTWLEKKFLITWKDWNGEAIKDANNDPITYELPYGATPQFLSTSPTREADVDYSYDFKGWSPAFAPVTGDQVYTAVYEKIPVKYEIVFKYEASIKQGAIISRQFLARDAYPDVPTLYPIDGYSSYEWTPAVSAVTGNATYEAKWLIAPPSTYEVTFKNYNGTTLKKNGGVDDAVYNVPAGELPVYDGETPAKPSTLEYEYEFIGWSPAIVAATAKATYIAQFNEKAFTYVINFYKEGTEEGTKDNDHLIASRTGLVRGANPTLPPYEKENPEPGHTYTLEWENMATGEVGVGVPSVSGDADYVASFRSELQRYTVTALSEDANGHQIAGCVFEGTGTFDYGTNLTLTALPNSGYEFVKWKDTESDVESRDITITGNITYIAVVQEASVVIGVDESQTIPRTTTVRNLIINSDNDDESGQLIGAENVVFADGGNAYFDLEIGDTERRHWHAFTVPFRVNLKKSGHPIQINGQELTLGNGYDIVFYDTEERAARGKVPSCWRFVEDPVSAGGSDSILYPGVGYMIASNSRAINTVRFTAELNNDKKLILDNGISVIGGDGINGGWNGIGNPKLYHTLIDAGVTECQVHNGEAINSDGYTTYDLSGKKLIVGKAVFIQAPADKSVVVNRAQNSDAVISESANAPHRLKANVGTENRFDVHIASMGEISADHIYLLTDDDKEDKYVILSDLAKVGLSVVRAQIWVNRYGTQLCKNTIAPIGNSADFPLGLYAPADGEYNIYIASKPNNGTKLYLTKDGQAIWNLSDGAATIQLNTGTTNSYGLRITAPHEVTTNIDEAIVDSKGETKKILSDKHVYIIREGRVYSIDGKLIK